jgi:hypothetical protein
MQQLPCTLTQWTDPNHAVDVPHEWTVVRRLQHGHAVVYALKLTDSFSSIRRGFLGRTAQLASAVDAATGARHDLNKVVLTLLSESVSE